MKLVIIAMATLLTSVVTVKSEETAAEFFRKDREGWTGNLNAAVVEMSADKNKVKQIIVEEVRAQIGNKWVPVALRLAHVESRFNPKAIGPKTRSGQRAAGVLQVMPSSARKLGYDPKRLNEARYGVRVGVAHMKNCISNGVRTEKEMAACHVAGPMGWKIKLRRDAEKYKHKYVAMVMTARVYR
jgi:hypothetical protein